MDRPRRVVRRRVSRYQRWDDRKDLVENYAYGRVKVRCYTCLIKINVFDMHKSHVIAVVYDGPDTIDNLRLCCSTCNDGCGIMNLHDYIRRKGKWNTRLNPHVRFLRENNEIDSISYPDPNSLLPPRLRYTEEPTRIVDGVEMWKPVRIDADEAEGSDQEEEEIDNEEEEDEGSEEAQEDDEEERIQIPAHPILFPIQPIIILPQVPNGNNLAVQRVLNGNSKWKKTILKSMKRILGGNVTSQTTITRQQLL